MEADNTNDSNLNSLKSMVLDEGKLITYITLSKDLCIHVNSSKLLMKKFVQTVRQEQPKLELNINYLISGLVDDTKIKISVCSEDELDDLKKSFNVVFFVHEYSISKGCPRKNIAAFVSLNKYDDLNLCPGIIKSHDIIKISHEEITKLKSNSQDNTSLIKPIPQNKPKEVEALCKVTENGKIVKTEPKLEREIKKEVQSPQKEQNSGKKIKPSTQKGIAGFFNKQMDNNTKKDKQQAIVSKVEKNVSVQKIDIEADTKIEKEIKKEKQENGISDNNKVLNHIKKNSKVEKKRKRVLRVSDSESEEENDPFVAEENHEIIHESDDEIPPTPAASNLKILTGIVNPRKKRKVVDKTYMSDDGFIITKREEVYESCSDTESMEKEQTVKQEIKEEKNEIIKAKLNEVKISPQKKKKISPPKGKQPTLMNFFKKK